MSKGKRGERQEGRTSSPVLIPISKRGKEIGKGRGKGPKTVKHRPLALVRLGKKGNTRGDSLKNKRKDEKSIFPSKGVTEMGERGKKNGGN